MADLNDITGWHEEFQALEESGDQSLGDLFERQGHVFFELKAPISEVFEFMEFVQKHEELANYAMELSAWQDIVDEYGGMADTHPRWSERPSGTRSIMYDFVDWYFLKTDAMPMKEAYTGTALYALARVLTGEFPAIRSQETHDFIMKWADNLLVSDVEGFKHD